MQRRPAPCGEEGERSGDASMSLLRRAVLAILASSLLTSGLRADDSFARVVEKVNPKLVKLFGSGGLRGLVSYGTGVLISPDGYILTANSHLLDTRDLRVHLHDGTRYHARVVVIE